MNGIHNSLSVVVCDDTAEAIRRGYNYAQNTPQPKPIRVKKVVVVREGTVYGNSTVDFLLEDENGQEFVFMVTGRLLRSIPTFAK